MKATGELLFTDVEYLAFMSGLSTLAYDPKHHTFKGRKIIVVDVEIEKTLEFHRYIVRKKLG